MIYDKNFANNVLEKSLIVESFIIKYIQRMERALSKKAIEYIDSHQANDSNSLNDRINVVNKLNTSSKVEDIVKSLSSANSETLRSFCAILAKKSIKKLSENLDKVFKDVKLQGIQRRAWEEEQTRLLNADFIDYFEKYNSGLSTVVYNSWSRGEHHTSIAQTLKGQVGKIEDLDLSKELNNRASFLARNAVQRLQSTYNQLSQQNAGIINYIWLCNIDGRERKTHKEINGKLCSWGKKPLLSDGTRAHPGEEFGCRCVAQAVE